MAFQSNAFQNNAFQISGSGSVNYVLALDAGTYTISGQDATFTFSRSLPLDAGAYSISGQDAILAYVPGTPTVDYILICDAGSYFISGQDAVLTFSGAPTATPIYYNIAMFGIGPLHG